MSKVLGPNRNEQIIIKLAIFLPKHSFDLIYYLVDNIVQC